MTYTLFLCNIYDKGEEVKLKIKLSLIMTAIVAVIAVSIAVIQLRQASSISRELSKQGLSNLAL